MGENSVGPPQFGQRLNVESVTAARIPTFRPDSDSDRFRAMRIVRNLIPLVGLLAVAACGGGAASGPTETASGTQRRSNQGGGSFESYVEVGRTFQEQGRCAEAIARGYDPAIAAFEDEHRGARVVGSRSGTPAATLGALLVASAADEDTVVVGSDYSDVMYFAAYCSVELGDLDRAEGYLRKALGIIPDDPLYANELGHIEQSRGAFEQSLRTFRASWDAAAELERIDPSVEALGHSIATLRHRAMRGVGFSLIELRRFDEAERVYREILSEDPSDAQARNELAFIAEQRQR